MPNCSSGGWLTLLMAAIWGFCMWTWNWGTVKKIKYNEARIQRLKDVVRQEVRLGSEDELAERLTLVATGEQIHRWVGGDVGGAGHSNLCENVFVKTCFGGTVFICLSVFCTCTTIQARVIALSEHVYNGRPQARPGIHVFPWPSAQYHTQVPRRWIFLLRDGAGPATKPVQLVLQGTHSPVAIRAIIYIRAMLSEHD